VTVRHVTARLWDTPASAAADASMAPHDRGHDEDLPGRRPSKLARAANLMFGVPLAEAEAAIVPRHGGFWRLP
jgi:hypothetical protein